MNTHTEPIQLICQEKLLQGMLHFPKDPLLQLPPLVVGSHGLEGSMESAKQKLLSKLLPEHGIAFLRFDHRGCGISEGSFATDTSLSKRVQDMLCIIDHVQQLKLTDQRLFLFGSSLGGSTCISTWSRLVEKGINPYGAILCAAPVNSLTTSQIPTKGNDHRPALPISFFEDNLLFDLTDKLSIMHNVLIFHGDKDQTVPVENAYSLNSNVSAPKKLIIFNGGDHQMSDITDQKRFEEEAVAWLKKTFSDPSTTTAPCATDPVL